MSWKEWPSWVRGGMGGLITGIILGYFAFHFCFLAFIFGGIGSQICSSYALISLILPQALHISLSYYVGLSELNVLWVEGCIVLTLIGSIVGFIIGKIKSKKQEETQQ